MRNGDNRGWERVTEVLRQIASAKGGRGCPAAPSAASDGASSCSGSAASTPKESVSGDPAERDYVRAVLDCYLWLPGTASVTSRHDRKCARALFRRGVPLELVKSAMVVAVARRTFRSGGPLPRVRSVFYFLPVVEELLESPVVLGYVQYLKDLLRPLAAAKPNASGERPSGPSS